MRTVPSTLLVLSTAVTVPAQTIGSFMTSGAGCRDTPSALYEIFDRAALPPSTFDLDQSALEWTPNGVGCYAIAPGGRDARREPESRRHDGRGRRGQRTLPLGFSFVDATGATHTEADLAPNGHVYLGSGSTTAERCCSGTTALPSFLADGPSFAVFGQDLDPSETGAGTVWFDTDDVGGRQVAYWTWDAVAEWGIFGSSNTCQLQLWDDGRCVMVWNGVDHVMHSVIVGWSAGGGQSAAGSADLSSAPLDCGRFSLPVQLRSASFPTIGQTLRSRSSICRRRRRRRRS